MVDGNQEGRNRSSAPDAERDAGEPDQTRAFDRAADQEPGPGPRRAGPGETARPPAADQTAPYPPTGRPGVPPDATAPLPGGAGGNRPGEPAAWSGRAAVPAPTAREVRETDPVGWAGPEERPGGRPWWLPILAGVVALLLLTALAVGLWLISQSRDGEAPVPPTPPPSPVPTSAAPAPSSAPPTTERPSPTPSETTAATVRMPPVVGLPQQAATALLDQLGLTYRLRFRQSDQPPGTVIRSDPEAGTPVSPDTRITLVIAEPRGGAATTAPAPATSSPGTTG